MSVRLVSSGSPTKSQKDRSHMSGPHVRPNVKRLTDSDARHLLAERLVRVCHKHGPSRVALEVGCDEKTIRRARDEESTLGLACAFNLLDVDETALDALLAAKGFVVRPVVQDAESDATDQECVGNVVKAALLLTQAIGDNPDGSPEIRKHRGALALAHASLGTLLQRMDLEGAA